jgi:hypothetical protein
MNSKVFQYSFDFDEWPGTHTIKEKYLRPYNGSIFNIRDAYADVFPEKEFKAIDVEDSKNVDTSKVYKLQYTLNLLPGMAEHRDVDFTTDKESL